MKQGLLVNLALSVGVSVAFMAALEGVARVLEEPRESQREVADYIWDWDAKMPGGFYVMASDGVGWPPYEEFNADGLRDRTRPREKPSGTWRIAVLGDSVTLGDGLKPRDAYPQILESRLEAEGRRIEVMNVSLWGWSTRQERIAWQRIARDYDPDQVVLAVCLNDIPELHNNLTRPPAWLVWLHERSALVRRLIDAEGREIEDVERLFETPDAPRVEAALGAFFDEIRELKGEVEADGAELSVVVFPFRFQLEDGAPPPIVQERIAGFCEAEGLECVDLLPALGSMGPGAFSDYDHLSVAGSRLTATTLLEAGLVPEGFSSPDTLAAHFDDAPTVSELIQALESEDEALRLAAAWGLESAGEGAAQAWRPLVSALEGDESVGVRAAAARALGALGDGAAEAIPALFEAQREASEAVRYGATRALAELRLTVDDIPRLEAALQSPHVYVRAFAAWRLGNFREEGEAGVPALAEALALPDTFVTVSAALARIGPAATEAVPVLVAELESPDEGRRWRAARTLGRIGPGAADAVPSLIASLDDPNEGVRLRIVRALGRIGPDERSEAALQRATGDSDAGVRREAEEALERLHQSPS